MTKDGNKTVMPTPWFVALRDIQAGEQMSVTSTGINGASVFKKVKVRRCCHALIGKKNRDFNHGTYCCILQHDRRTSDGARRAHMVARRASTM